MPASQIESPGNTSFAAIAPSTIVSSIPTLSRRAGRFRIPRKTFKSVRLASVKSNRTSPTSARCKNIFGVPPDASIPGSEENISMPVTVNTIGAVTTVRST